MSLPPPRQRAVWIALGALTAAQLGIGVWRAAVMLRQGVEAGARPFVLSGVAGEVALSALLAALAWWWLPARGSGGRSLAAWAVRFVLFAWTLALAHYVVGLATGRLAPFVTPVALVLFAALGAWVRRWSGSPGPAATSPTPDTRHPVLWLAVALWLYQLVHLPFPYHFTDAHDIWACRAFKFAEHGALTGVFDCLDPARPPLYSVLLWLGAGDPTFQGRLLPTLMVGAFAILFYRLVRRVAPRLAPWGVVWLLATDHVMKGAVSFYAGVPVMIAAVVAIALWVDDGTLAPRRLAIVGAAVLGAAVALIRRDGLPEFAVAGAVVMLRTRAWREPRLWAAAAGVAVGYLSWTLRPAVLHAPALFAPTLDPQVPWTLASAAHAMGRLLYGAQGQVFSHYGYGVFAWGWIVLAVWAWRRAGGPALAVTLGLAGLAAWLATLALYAILTFAGHPQMSTLFVIRTGFGRHLVHFYPLCLLHAVNLAERLLPGRSVG
ncbi:MAG TPA: hypothetical protein VF890_00275 [Gemmatimonadales bacterium]